eukprot:Nk52_evm2s533 gene=Nk52_evmTU2s533
MVNLCIPPDGNSAKDMVKSAKCGILASDFNIFTFTYNGTTRPITYGDLVSMPDYFGSVVPLSSYGYNPDDMVMQAQRWWYTIWQVTNDADPKASSSNNLYKFSPKYLNMIKNEYEKEWAYVKKVVPTEADPFTHWPSLEDELNEATGGAPFSPYPISGGYITLEAINLDHIGSDALKAWVAMRILALRTAAEAARLRSRRLYIRALGMNAFGDHFFSDTFSSGHVRVPRRVLWQYYGAFIGGAMTRAMHNEDCQYGLWLSPLVNDDFNKDNTSPMFTWDESEKLYYRQPATLYASQGYSPESAKSYWPAGITYLYRTFSGGNYFFNGAFCDEHTPCSNGNECGKYNASMPNSCGPPFGFEYPTKCLGTVPDWNPRF